jgi:murein DD-endopeptidase MepM/ murein hydrolase activator NlpD
VFGDPVAGEIHPTTWQRPAGNRDFKVTSPFGPRVIIDEKGKRVRSVHKGMDLGNGREGDPVYAQATGRIVELRIVLDGVVTIQTSDNQWQLVAAHMKQIPGTFRKGTPVARGQIIGRVGQVGAPGQPHVHVENKKLSRLTRRYVAQNPWPLLEQNQEVESMTIVTRTPFAGGPLGFTAPAGKLTGYLPTGSTKTVTFSAPSRAHATGYAVITQDPPKTPNGTFLEVADGALAGYYIIPSTVQLDPVSDPTEAAKKAGAEGAAGAAQEYADSL